jgi:colicin import membrane protein
MSMLMHNLKQAEESRLARAKAQDRAAVEAEAEQAARERIGANSSRLEELKANELAEAEALALARIRAQSERTLAAQAEALRDAERKLELTVIDRRSTDLEAAREAANREAADIAARAAAEKRAGAEREATLAAQQRAEAATQATAAAEARRQAVIGKNSAVAARRRAQWAAFWAGARFKPVASVGALMLALGVGGGIWLSGRLPRLTVAPGELPELRLRLDDSVESFAQRVVAMPPRDLRQRPRRP